MALADRLDIVFPLQRLREDRQLLRELPLEGGAAGRILQLILAAPDVRLEKESVLRPLDALFEGFGAFVDDEFVRVLVRPHVQTAAFDAGRAQDGDAAHGGVHAGGVAVVAEDDRFAQTPEQLGVAAGQGRAERRDRAVKARLMQGDDVHIPFAEKKVRTAAGPGQIQAVEVAAFIEDRRLRGV